ncbi:hypothetical protein GCM10011376_11530 [Nocardioides flavus (ex Wang et al. 2016)]|uniref:Uncharacterized protein n=1 Tax=Nocardioides flavus (ex Wang et al. 2016) TaxID=2058780 RepID=A0ABQ3HG00_9ACTN|nr:hypothetical protein [Nocardioides flavus (ex Wang et al. 2016)]GHE16543.1 hypothetical protein GCM10011376_11530 [Nocardioides flavus (ex Wang et al. 2016)]
MDVYRLVLTILVLAGVVVAILLFEKRRAQGIERDTRDMAQGQDRQDDSPDDLDPDR